MPLNQTKLISICISKIFVYVYFYIWYGFVDDIDLYLYMLEYILRPSKFFRFSDFLYIIRNLEMQIEKFCRDIFAFLLVTELVVVF